jgi:putative membrane protein
MMMWYSGGWGWAGWILMTIGMVAFWALIITAIILAVDYLAGSHGTAASPTTRAPTRSEDVLTERFARGEIDDDEYQRRLALLHQNR